MDAVRGVALAVAIEVLGTTAGCGMWNGLNTREKATVGGAAAGGVIGNAVGGGALGTVGGAAAGGLIGNQLGKDRQRR